jgi:muskelin
VQHKETATLRHVLKYLRQRRHFSSFHGLQSRTGLSLEHPIVTKIYDNLISGNWSVVESLIQATADAGLFDDCIQACDPKSLWRRLNGANADGDVPSSRGGHQMCIDAAEGIIYMFGGWDGKKNLDDLWSYSIVEERWKLLSSSTEHDGGPGPRSCHKMVFDPELGYIYLLGSLDDSDGPKSPSPSGTVIPAHPQNLSSPTHPMETTANPSPESSLAPTTVGSENGSKRPSIPSRFYRYTTRGLNAGTWTTLSADTNVRRSSEPSIDIIQHHHHYSWRVVHPSSMIIKWRSILTSRCFTSLVVAL